MTGDLTRNWFGGVNHQSVRRPYGGYIDSCVSGGNPSIDHGSAVKL
jgi:hypothetical protein